jgi:radical SAM protein with 4Fe4S-binding SPASM domain
MSYIKETEFTSDADQKIMDYYDDCPYFKLMHIEVSSLCNLQCSHCQRNLADYPSKNVNMESSLFEKIIDEVQGKIELLQLQGLGEPTIHPTLPELIYYARGSKKFNVITMTSNLLFRNYDEYDVYFENGLDSLTLSLDSIDETNINLIRQGSELKKLLNNIVNFNKKYLDRLTVQTTLNNINITEVDTIARLMIETDIKKWILVAESYDKSKKESRIEFEKYSSSSLTIKQIKGIENYVRGKYSHNLIIDTVPHLYQHPMSRVRCLMPWEWVHINSNGSIVPCCRYFDDQYVNFGNVKDHNLNEIWQSAQMQLFRNRMYDIQPVICQNCDGY